MRGLRCPACFSSCMNVVILEAAYWYPSSVAMSCSSVSRRTTHLSSEINLEFPSLLCGPQQYSINNLRSGLFVEPPSWAEVLVEGAAGTPALPASVWSCSNLSVGNEGTSGRRSAEALTCGAMFILALGRGGASSGGLPLFWRFGFLRAFLPGILPPCRNLEL